MNALPTLSLSALLLAACAAEQPALDADEQVAVDAAIASLDPVRADLPIEDDELEALAVSDVVEARDYADCEVLGVLSGVWYDEALAAEFEGAWFRLGSGEQGGTLGGSYGDGLFTGSFDGSNAGTLEGSYDDGLVLGAWAETDGDGAVLSTGELIGRYERRNEVGGYFFGLWGRCP